MGKQPQKVINSVSIPDTWVCDVELFVSAAVPDGAGYQANAPKHLEVRLTEEMQRGLSMLTFGSWHTQQLANGKPVRSHADAIRSLLERIGKTDNPT